MPVCTSAWGHPGRWWCVCVGGGASFGDAPVSSGGAVHGCGGGAGTRVHMDWALLPCFAAVVGGPPKKHKFSRTIPPAPAAHFYSRDTYIRGPVRWGVCVSVAPECLPDDCGGDGLEWLAAPPGGRWWGLLHWEKLFVQHNVTCRTAQVRQSRDVHMSSEARRSLPARHTAFLLRNASLLTPPEGSL